MKKLLLRVMKSGSRLNHHNTGKAFFYQEEETVMRRGTLMLVFVFLMATPLFSMTPSDFGRNGLKGLTEQEKEELARGEVVFFTSDSGDEVKRALIQAVVTFDPSPEEVWPLLYRTEDQIKYLEEIRDIQVINKEKTRDNIEFHLKIAWMDIVYRVIHQFDRDGLFFHWGLDPSFDNELKELEGYWQLYPYGNGKTLARYGSQVSVRKVPSFIENLFKKNGVRKSLEAVQKYVNSGGTWRHD